MRKLTAMLLAMLLLLSLAACGGDEGDGSSAPVSSENGVSTPSEEVDTSTTTSEADSGKTTTTKNNQNTTSRSSVSSKDTTTSKFVLPTSGNWEKPYTGNAAILYNKQTSAYDKQAENMRQTVLNAKDTLKPSGSGKTYYISYRGDDANDGLSPNTPWKSPAKVSNTLNFRSGDVVLFERGGIYRDVGFKVLSGVSYGAYGTGAKPQLFGGDKNYADESLWEKTSTANVWRAKVAQVSTGTASEIEDIGNIVFDHGKICASDAKELSLGKLDADYDFYFDAKTDYVYLYLSKGNPGKLHTSVEIAPNEHIIRMEYGAKNITIENLCLKYTGAHGISASTVTNVTIRGCEIGYIGGGMLEKTTRFGNGIELFGASSNCTVENNWVYQCFDAGYTNQGQGWHTNITVKKNLMEYSPYNIEVWTVKEIGKGGLKNCTYSDNILRFAGYGFGSNRRMGSDTSVVGNISMYTYVVPCENTVIKNNVFDCSYRHLVSIVYPNDAEGRGPTITGNAWNQKPFSNDVTEAIVGHCYLSGGVKKYKCSTLDEMKTGVAIFDTAPKSVTLEK